MFYATKTFKFEGAHVLKSSYSKECQDIHGHSYTVDVTVASEEPNEDGMVIDFKELKNLVGHLFDDLDHAMIFHKDTYLELLDKCPAIYQMNWNMVYFDWNPTAENMASHFYYACKRLLLSKQDISVFEVTVRETQTGEATYCEGGLS